MYGREVKIGKGNDSKETERIYKKKEWREREREREREIKSK